MGSDQSKYAGAGEKSEEAQEARLDYYALLSVDEEATAEEIKVRSARDLSSILATEVAEFSVCLPRRKPFGKRR